MARIGFESAMNKDTDDGDDADREAMRLQDEYFASLERSFNPEFIKMVKKRYGDDSDDISDDTADGNDR